MSVVRLAQFLSLLLLLVSPAAARAELLPGYPDKAPRGAAAAKGAVIYSHGLVAGAPAAPDLAAPELPYVLDPLRESGWDVFRLQRPFPADTLAGSVAALGDAARRLHAGGYAKVVLVGQSFGGWISLAASPGTPVHAVVAFAPAAYGTRQQSPDWTHNADGLYALAEQVAAGRVLVFLFEQDDFDPGGRGGKLREIFQRRDIAATVVDRPFDLAGHGIALSRGFSRRFGACLRDFLETASPAPRFVCGGEPPAAALDDFVLPPGLTVRAPAPGTAPRLAALLGRWYGVYPNGREVLLVIEEAAGGTARAVYSFGRLARHLDEQANYTRRQGTFDAATGTLVFREPQLSSDLDARLGADGRLDFTWTERQSGQRFSARLRKID